MKQKFIRFMQGRYGVDQLSKVMMGLAVVMILLSSFVKTNIFYYVGWLFIIVTYFRMFSKNYAKRRAENQWYMNTFAPIRNFFNRKKNLMAQRKTHHIYTCPTCKQKIRVPKGKGKIEVTCPKCHGKFIKRS